MYFDFLSDFRDATSPEASSIGNVDVNSTTVPDFDISQVTKAKKGVVSTNEMCNFGITKYR